MARNEGKDLMRREPSVLSPFEEMERFFETVMGRPFMTPSVFFRGSPMLQEMAPSVDIYEENDQVVVRAEIPGMKKEDIDINITDDAITLSGEKKQEEQVERKDFFRMESSYGSFTRTLRLPCEVQTEQARATYREGVLEVRVPKSAAAKEKVKKLTIQ